MKQKSVGMTLRAVIIALALILVAGSPALPPFDGVAYAQAGLSAVVAPNGDSVILSWGAISDADSYEVWKGDGRGSSVDWGSSALTSVTTPSYTDDAVTGGATYSYAIRPVEDGTAGTWSNVESRTIPGGTTAPTSTPTVTVAAVGTTAVDVSWTSVAGATSYHIQFWHAALGNNWDRIPGDQTSPYSHTGLTTGREYFYVVRAANAGGNGDWSNWRTDNSKVTLAATSSVPALTLDHQSRTVVQLSWTASSGGSTYNLQRRKITTDSSGMSTPDDSTMGWATLPSAGALTSTSYTDRAANYVPGDGVKVEYEYRVRASDSNNIAGDWSAVKSVTIPSAGAVLAAPSITPSAVSSSSTRVNWPAVDGAAFYELQWKSGDRNYTNPIPVDGLVYEHTNLSQETRYTYQVRAVDINGVGAWSSERSVTTLSVTAAAGQMPKVQGLRVTDATTDNVAGQRFAKLTWSTVSGATHYEINRFNPVGETTGWAAPTPTEGDAVTLTGGRLTVTEATASPTWTDTIASTTSEGAGKTYFYVVSAVDDRSRPGVPNTEAADDDLGEWSDYKSVTFTAHEPPVPAGLTAAKTNGASIIVRWTQSDGIPTTTVDLDEDEFPTGAATSWTLQWRIEEGTWSNITVPRTATANAYSYHHTGLRDNTIYQYQVRAENTGGESAYFPTPTDTPVSVMLGNTLTRPTNVKAEDATAATGTDYKIKVSWSAVADANSYEVQLFNPTAAEGGAWHNLVGAAGETEVLPTAPSIVPPTEVTDDTGDVANTTHLYRVRMVKEGIRSGWSDVASGTTRAVVPDAAPALDTTATGQKMIRVSWVAIAGAISYHLEYLEGASVGTDFVHSNVTPRRIPTISGNFNNYNHINLKPGTQYRYRIRVVLPSGEGAWTVATETVPQVTKPATPDLTATATDSATITLKWDAVTYGLEGIEGAGAPETLTAFGDYLVEWRVAQSGTAWAAVGENSNITCPSDKCMLEDAGLTASTTYQYRIRAESEAGNSYWDYTDQRTPKAPE